MIQESYEDQKKHIHVLSYGGGTQSTALLILALEGKVEGVIPNYIIFSDTGWESKIVYEWIDKVNNYIKERFDREIIIVQKKNLREDLLKAKDGERVASIPFYTRSSTGQKGMVLRQCTQEYKIAPVNKMVRELLGYKPRQKVKELVHIWKGISTDEIQRVKPIKDHWLEAEHPLIDYLEMDREECIAFVESTGLGTPPRSSCIGCPFHSNDYWLDMKLNDKESWEEAVFIDKQIRHLPKFKNRLYLHRSATPLEEVEFREQSNIDDFINECEGFCGN